MSGKENATLKNRIDQIWNAGLLVTVFTAVLTQWTWLGYLVAGFTWFMCSLYLVTYMTHPDRRLAAQTPRWFFVGVDVLVFALMMYAQWYATAFAYATSCVVLDGMSRTPPRTEATE